MYYWVISSTVERYPETRLQINESVIEPDKINNTINLGPADSLRKHCKWKHISKSVSRILQILMIDVKFDWICAAGILLSFVTIIATPQPPRENRIYFDPWNLPQNSVKVRSTEREKQQDQGRADEFSTDVLHS